MGDHPKRAMDVKEKKILKGENKGRVVDRISELPDSLLHHILSFLPIKQVVITSILSKRWRYLWASLPILNFEYLEPYTSNRNLKLERARKFMNFVERFLFGHDMNIQKLNLYIEGEIDKSCVNAYISKVIRHKVQDLSLYKDFWFEHFVFPPNLITCESLLKLTIHGNFVFKFPSSTCFPSLKILNLSNFEFSDDYSTQQLFSNCPVLEELIICLCKWDDLSILCISGPVLKRLKINDYQNEWDCYFSDCVIKINAPNLEYLSYFCYLPIDFDLCNFSSLAYAEICLIIQESVSCEEEAESESESVHCASKLFGALSNVNVLNISGEMFEILSNTKDLLTHNPKFHNLIRLEVSAKHYDLSGRVLLDLLQIMPNLECLIFDKLSTNDEYWTYEKVPQCLLLHLKEVKIKKFSGCKTEFYVLKFLLENAKVLERMTISSCYSMRDPQKKLKIMNKLLIVPRGSTHCVIEFL